MSRKSRTEYYLSIKERYRNADKRRKEQILNEYCKICGYNRKYAIRVLNRETLHRVRRKPGRPKEYYNTKVVEFLLDTWKATHFLCSGRLKASIKDWLPSYKDSNRQLSNEEVALIQKISSRTIERVLKPFKNKYKVYGIATTKPGSILKEFISIKTKQWDQTCPGFLEADTVAHCGANASGDFIFTVNMVDIATGWTIQRAVWGKGETGVQEAIISMENTLPFTILGFDTDNGGEFLNWGLISYFKNRKHKVELSRSRPYEKNDNAHIEGKNWTLIRQYLGYERFDKLEILRLLNELYKGVWYRYTNYFLPSVKLQSKIRVGSKIIKKHDDPKTPFERLLQSKEIKEEVKMKLRREKEGLNPYSISGEIERRIKQIKQLAKHSRENYNQYELSEQVSNMLERIKNIAVKKKKLLTY